MKSNNTTTKMKIVLAKKPSSTEFCVYDYSTLKTLDVFDLSKLTLPQCVNMLKDHYEIAGFLSHGMIIPLVGLIPGHEDKRIEDVHERLLEAATDQFESFKEEFSGPVELPSLDTVGESEAVPGLEQKER